MIAQRTIIIIVIRVKLRVIQIHNFSLSLIFQIYFTIASFTGIKFSTVNWLRGEALKAEKKYTRNNIIIVRINTTPGLR